MKIKVTSDSTCDLPVQLLEQYNITIQPLTVVRDGCSYKDAVDITPADIFAHVAAGGSLCSTSAVNIGEYEALFSRFAGDYDAVIHINLGSGFSTCYQNACLAAEEFDNVRVIDSRNLTTGQAFLVLEACRLGEALDDLDLICETLEQAAEKVESSFLINRLDYLVKGGRCSALTALGANLLNLKPCIEVRDNKMVVGKKYRGNYAKCLANYVKDRLSGRSDINEARCFFTYTTLDEACYQAAADAIGKYGHFSEITQAVAGCTISCHCGPDTMGVILLRE